jgi:hypothetical protein
MHHRHQARPDTKCRFSHPFRISDLFVAEAHYLDISTELARHIRKAVPK